jgi:hypothetical protein
VSDKQYTEAELKAAQAALFAAQSVRDEAIKQLLAVHAEVTKDRRKGGIWFLCEYDGAINRLAAAQLAFKAALREFDSFSTGELPTYPKPKLASSVAIGAGSATDGK